MLLCFWVVVGFWFSPLLLSSWCSVRTWNDVGYFFYFSAFKGVLSSLLGSIGIYSILCKSCLKVNYLGKENDTIFCPCIYEDYLVPLSSSCTDATSSASVCGSSQSICSKHAMQDCVSHSLSPGISSSYINDRYMRRWGVSLTWSAKMLGFFLALGAMRLMVYGSLYCLLLHSQALVPLKPIFMYCGLSRKCLFWKVKSRNILET